jgi:hypothetical protein
MSEIGDNSGAVNLSVDVQDKLKKVINEISDSMTRIEAERDLIKESVKRVSEETVVEKKLIRKMAKTFHKNSFESDVTEQRDFESIFEIVTKRQ